MLGDDDLRVEGLEDVWGARMERPQPALAPAWTTDWITPQALEKLRAFGIAPPQHGAADNVVRFASRTPGSHDAVACPHCGSLDTTETSHFSSTACKALYRCLSCREPFDYFKPF